MALTVNFTGPTAANNTINELAPDIFNGGAPDFGQVSLAKDNSGKFQLFVHNSTGITGWPPAFFMAPVGDDSIPQGKYSGGGGTAVVG